MQKKKQLIENVNTVTRRERRRFIGEHLSFIKTTQINVYFLSGHYTQEISYFFFFFLRCIFAEANVTRFRIEKDTQGLHFFNL